MGSKEADNAEKVQNNNQASSSGNLL